MTKRQALYIFLSSLVLSVILFVAGVTIGLTKTPTVIAYSEPEPIAFVLKEYEGRLALFRGDSQSPYQKTDFYVSNLNEHDRELVAAGISVDTEAELRSLIEDMTG